MLFINFLCLLYLMVLSNGYTITNTINKEEINELSNAVTKLDKRYGILHERNRRKEKTKHHNINKNTKIHTKSFTSGATVTAVNITPTTQHLKHISPKRKICDFWRKYKGKKLTNESKKGGKKEGKRKDKEIQHNAAQNAKNKHQKTKDKREHVWRNPRNSKQKIAKHSINNLYGENKKSKRNLHILQRSESVTTKADEKSKPTAKKFKEVSSIRIGITPQAVVISKNGSKNHSKHKIKANKDIKNIISSISPQLVNKKKKYKYNQYGSVSPSYVYEKTPSKTTTTRPLSELETTVASDFLRTAQIEDLLNNIKLKTIQMISESNSSLSDMIINSATERFLTVEPFLIQMPSTVLKQSLLKLVAINDGNKIKEKIHKERALNIPVSIGYNEPHDLMTRSLKSNTIAMVHNAADNIQQKIKNVIKKIKTKVSNSYKNSTIKKTTKKILNMTKAHCSKFSKSSPNKLVNNKLTGKNTTPLNAQRSTRRKAQKLTTRSMKSLRSLPTFDDTVMPLYEDMLEKSQEEIAKKNTSKFPFIKKEKKHHKLHKRGHSSSTGRVDDIMYNEMPNDYLEPASTSSDDSFTSTTIDPIEGTSFHNLSNKISYSDYVNGYKHYLKFQKDQANDKFSAMVKYQAHRHHNVDDIGKYILEKIPTVPTFNYTKERQRQKRFFDDTDIDDQEMSTKTDESWFKKHFYLFIDKGPPKKFHTSQTVSLKSPLTEMPYLEEKKTKKSRLVQKEPLHFGGDGSDSTHNDDVYAEPTLEYLSETFSNKKANKLPARQYQGKHLTTDSEPVVSLFHDLSNVTNKTLQLNFMAQLFGKKYRRTLKNEIKWTTFDFGDRIKRASNEETNPNDVVTKYETSVTVSLAKFTKNNENTHHKSNKFGYVDINLLVPKGTAVVKLRENTRNKSKFKEFLKKISFKGSKAKNKRSCNPFKKLKDIFKHNDEKVISTKPIYSFDKNNQVHNFSNTKLPQSEISKSTHSTTSKVDPVIIRNQVPNINATGIDNISWTPTTPLPGYKGHMKESNFPFKAIKKDKQVVKPTDSTHSTATSFSNGSWSSTTPMHAYKSDLEGSKQDPPLRKSNKKGHETVLMKPLNSALDIGTSKSIADTSLEKTGSLPALTITMESHVSEPNKHDADIISVTVTKSIEEATTISNEPGEDYDNLEFIFAKNTELARNVGNKREKTARNEMQAAAIEKINWLDEEEFAPKIKVTRNAENPRLHFNRRPQLLRRRSSMGKSTISNFRSARNVSNEDNDISKVIENINNVIYVPEVKYDEQQPNADIFQNSIEELVSKDSPRDEYKKPDYFDDLINWNGDILNQDKVQTIAWNANVNEGHRDLGKSLASPNIHEIMTVLKKYNDTELGIYKSLKPTVTRIYDVNENKIINNLELNDKTDLKNRHNADFLESNRPMSTDSLNVYNISQSGGGNGNLDEWPNSVYATGLIHSEIPVLRDRYSVVTEWVNKFLTVSRIPGTSCMVSPRHIPNNANIPLVTVTVVTDQPNDLKTDVFSDCLPADSYVKGMRRVYIQETSATPPLMIDSALLSYGDEVENVGKRIHVKKLSKNSLSWPGQANNLMTTHENLMTKLNKQPPQCYTTPLPMKSKDFEKFLKDEGMDMKSLTEPMKESTAKDSTPKSDDKDNIITLLNAIKVHKKLKSKSDNAKALIAKAGTKKPFTMDFSDRYKRLVKISDGSKDDLDHNRLRKKINIFDKILHNMNDDETSTSQAMSQTGDNISLAIDNLHKKAKELPIIDVSDLITDDISMKNMITKENYNNERKGELEANLANTYNDLAIHNHLLYNNKMYHGTSMDKYQVNKNRHVTRYVTVPFGNVYRSAGFWQKTKSKQPKKVEITSHHYKYDIIYDNDDVNGNVEKAYKRGIEPLLKVGKTYMKHPKITAKQSKSHSGTGLRKRRGRRRFIRKVNALEKSSSATATAKTDSGITEHTTSQKRILDVFSSKFVMYTAEPVYKFADNKVQSPSDEGFVIKVERGNSSGPTTTNKMAHKTTSKHPKWLTISVHPSGKLINDKDMFINDRYDKRNSGLLPQQINFFTALNIDSVESTTNSKMIDPYVSRLEDAKIFKDTVTEFSKTSNDGNVNSDSESNIVDMLRSEILNLKNIPSEYTKLNEELASHTDSKDKINSGLEYVTSSSFDNFEPNVKDPVSYKARISKSTPMFGKYLDSQQSAEMATVSTLNHDDAQRNSRFVYLEPTPDKLQQMYTYKNTTAQSGDYSKNDSQKELLQQKVTSAYDHLHLDKKRDVENQEVFTAKDVAALEVIVDLMKNTLSYEEKDISGVFSNNLMLESPVKSIQQSQDSTNSILVHIAIPFDIQSGKKRSALDPMRVRRVFSARMFTPVDLEYQIHSFEEAPDTTAAVATSTADDGLSPGMYLLIDKPNNAYALKPVKAKIDLTNVKYRQITTPLILKEGSTRRHDIKEMDKVTLSKDLISAINKQLVEMYENFTTARGEGRVRKKRAVHTPFYFHRREPRTKSTTKFVMDSRYRVRRVIDWNALQHYFGRNRVCNCKYKPYKPMCRACAASDVVMNELIFEFNNIEQYMKDHCTELQTYFWMNPSGGLRLRDTVHNIDKSLNDYYKRVRGKCQGKTCKAFGTNIDKREFIKRALVPKEDDGRQITDDLASLARDLNRTVRMSTCFNRRLSEEGAKMLHAINACICPKNYKKRSDALTTKKKLIKNVYSLDNINVNIICHPDVQTADILESPVSSTTLLTTSSATTASASSMPTTSTTFSSSNNIIPSTTTTSTTSSTSEIPTPNQILTSQNSQDQENLFEFDLDEDNGKHKKRKGFKCLFPRRKKKDKLFTYYTIDSNTTPKPLFKRDTYNQLEIPLISDGGGRFWFDYLHSSSTSEILSAREIKKKDSNTEYGTTVVATTTNSKMQNGPRINIVTQILNATKSKAMKTENQVLKNHVTHNVMDASNINAHVTASKAISTETNSEMATEYLSDDINQFLKLFGNTEDIEAMNRNSNRSTQLPKLTQKQESKITHKPTIPDLKKIKSSTNTHRKNKTTTSIRTTGKINEKSAISNKTTTTTTTTPLSLEDLEKEVSSVYSSKVSGHSKKTTSKRHSRTGKKHTKSNSKKTKATHRSVTIVSKEPESSTASSHDTGTKTMNSTFLKASQKTTQHVHNTNKPYDYIPKTTIIYPKRDKISRKIQKSNIFGHLKSVTLNFLGLTRHNTEITTEMEQKSNMLVDKISKAETKPSGDLTEVPTRQNPSILVINEYDSHLTGDTLDQNPRKSDYKNLLLSILQYESNKLKEEWKKLSYGFSDDGLKESTKPPTKYKDPPKSKEIFKENKIKKTTVKHLKDTKVDIVEHVTNSILELDVPEPEETVNFDLNKYMKRPGLLEKIAGKMGMKIIPVDKTTEKVAKQSYSKETQLKAEKSKEVDPAKNIDTREASDSYQPNKFVCDLQSTYNHVSQLRNELMEKEFEAYVKKIPCYKYKRIQRSFFINHKTGGLKWDWIRNRRSLGHREMYKVSGERSREDDDNKEYCDAFETFVKDDDGIYRVGSRRKRSADESNDVALKSLPPILPATNEVFFMLDDSFALDCLPPHDVRSAESQGQCTWDAERKDMLEQENVQVDGSNLLIRKAGPKNSGTYTCSVDDTVRRNVRVVVVTLPSIDVVFVPVYKLPRECTYHDLKAMQLLAREMSKEISCGNVCSVRIDEPVCQIDRAKNQSFIKSTTVLSLSPRKVRCSVQCRRDFHSSMVRLSAANVPALKNTNVLLSRDGVNDTLSPCKDDCKALITHKLRKKDSSGHHEYHKLTETADVDKVHIVVVCDAGYYLMQDQNICAPCPSNTSSLVGDNRCTPCPAGTSADPGSKDCRKHSQRHRRYDWWWYPPCGYVVGCAAVGGACGLCLLLSLAVQLVTRSGDLPAGTTCATQRANAAKNPSTVCGHVQYGGKSRPLSPSRVILARFFKPSLTSSRATAVDSQETRFELWKERNIPPPLPAIDFDLETS